MLLLGARSPIRFTNNDYDMPIHDSQAHRFALENQIAKHGIDPAANDWLKKALHPPFDITDVAIPDNTFRPGVRLDLRPSIVISPPDGLPADETWDCCIVTLPGDVNGAAIACAPSGADFTGKTQASWELHMLTLQGGAPADSFAVQDISFGGTPPIDPYSSLRTRVSCNPMSFRTTYRSITTHLTASNLNNQGSVVCGQVDNDWAVGTGFAILKRPDNNYLAVPHVSALPLTNEQITQLCPGSYVGEARDGVYIPHRLIGPSQPFVAQQLSAGRTCREGIPADSMLSYVAENGIVAPSTLPATPRIVSADTGQTPWLATDNWIREAYDMQYVIDDTGFDKCASTVTIFRGLSPAATLTSRMFVGLETVVHPTSPLASFVKSPADPDHHAIQLYYELVTRMKTVYPADYNGLGTLIPILASAASYVIPKVMPYLKRGAEDVVKYIANEFEGKAVHAAKAAMKKKPAAKRPVVTARPSALQLQRAKLKKR